MKNYIKTLGIIAICLLFPFSAFALTSTWQATSSTSTQIFPTAINGTTPVITPNSISTSTPVNGYVLQTNGSINNWVATSSLGFGNSTSGGCISTNPCTASYFVATSSASSTFAAPVVDTLSTSNATSFETCVSGETYCRSYADGFGDQVFGGTGSTPPQFVVGKDPFNSTYLNIKCTANGPCIVTHDSYPQVVCGSSTVPVTEQDGESTLTNRIVLATTSSSQWVDTGYNYYCSNGDRDAFTLMQKIGDGQYVPWIFAYNNDAASDPKGQIKNAQYFQTIVPNDPQGSASGVSISGTGTVTASSSIVTGNGTSFGTANSLNVGDSFAIGSIYATVLSVASTTQLTMAASSTITGTFGINKFNQRLGVMGIRIADPLNPLGFVEIGGGDTTTPQFILDNSTLTTGALAGAIENAGGQLYFSAGNGSRHSLVENGYGVSGGQTIIGGQGPSDNLTLQSTSNVTRGLIYFGGTQLSAYNEANSRLGIGTTSPATALSVTSSSTLNGLILPNLSNTILAVDSAGNVIATTTSAGGVTAVNASGGLQSSGGSSPTISPASGFSIPLTASATQWSNLVNASASLPYYIAAGSSSINSITNLPNLSLPFSQVTGTVPVNQGGTGSTSYAVGSLLEGSSTNSVNALLASTSGSVLAILPSGLPGYVATSSLGFGNSSGTVNSGTAGQVAVYNTSGTTVTGTSTIAISGATTTVTNNLAVTGNESVGSTTASSTFFIDTVGHRWSGGSTPTCTTGCTMTGGDDNNMRIVSGSSVTSITITFANTWTNPFTGVNISPICDANDESQVSTGVEASSTPTTVVLTLPTALTSKNIGVQCSGSINLPR